MARDRLPAPALRCSLCGRSPSVVILRLVMPGTLLLVRGCADCLRSSSVDEVIKDALARWRNEERKAAREGARS